MTSDKPRSSSSSTVMVRTAASGMSGWASGAGTGSWVEEDSLPCKAGSASSVLVMSQALMGALGLLLAQQHHHDGEDQEEDSRDVAHDIPASQSTQHHSMSNRAHRAQL